MIFFDFKALSRLCVCVISAFSAGYMLWGFFTAEPQRDAEITAEKIPN